MDMLSSKLKEISKSRKTMTLNQYDKNKIIDLHGFAKLLAHHADDKLFWHKIPNAEIQCWLDFVMERIRKLSNQPQWTTRGLLNDLDGELLASTLSMFSHPVPVSLAFEGEFFSVLAGFQSVHRHFHVLQKSGNSSCLSCLGHIRYSWRRIPSGLLNWGSRSSRQAECCNNTSGASQFQIHASLVKF